MAVKQRFNKTYCDRAWARFISRLIVCCFQMNVKQTLVTREHATTSSMASRATVVKGEFLLTVVNGVNVLGSVHA